MEPHPPPPGKPDKSQGLAGLWCSLLGCCQLSSPKMSQGVGPPSPPDAAAALQPGTMLRAEREGAAGTAPSPAAPAGRLWCRAFLLLAVCVCTTAVPYGLGVLAAVTWDPPGSSASQQRVGDSLVTACGDLLTSGCFPGDQGVVTLGPGAGGRSLGTRTAATWTSQTSLEWQPGSGDREGHRLSPAMAVTLSPAQWPGKRVPATSSRLFQTEGVPSPGSWHHLTERGLHRAGPGSHGATWMPAVTSAGTAEPQSPQRGSEATSRAWSEPAAGLPATSQPVHVLPLQFRLLGIAYTPALGSRNSESYQQLEGDVRLMLNHMLSSYESFLQANVLEFMNGSVVVRGEVLFRGDAPAPTNSHLIRTVLTEASKGRSIFSWQLDPQSVQSGGFSLENLDPEKLSVSLTGFQLGTNRRMDPLERLVSEVMSSVSALYHVRNFTISQLRTLGGGTEVTGDLYLDTVVHADVTEVLEALTTLSDLSIDLTSLSVEGSKLGLYVYPLSLVVTNRHFSQKLQDPLSEEHHNLSMDLGDAVVRVLSDYPTLLKVIIKEFLPGSVTCHGNMIFRHPAPTSMEVLRKLVLSVGPDHALGDSDIHVDPYSLAVGEDTLDPPLYRPSFPAYGVAIMVIGGLCIITAPIVLVCLGTKKLGWQGGRALWNRRDPEVGIQTLEMDNQGVWTEVSGLCIPWFIFCAWELVFLQVTGSSVTW
ncbi:PREDICTED: uncharacterized protein LOC106854904 [Sturnus vulgaris]|uniref:uncharacterized protein LOC106854904 n=1 Tax=Sturnus vulgaris TaxID=9172 RepID=UPI00071A5392|nr:PREDICTED: uncharacterized protein LOC106854904 [Sturnus vulgaris]